MYAKNAGSYAKILNNLILAENATPENIDASAELIGEGGFSVVKKAQISFQPVITKPQ